MKKMVSEKKTDIDRSIPWGTCYARKEQLAASVWQFEWGAAVFLGSDPRDGKDDAAEWNPTEDGLQREWSWQEVQARVAREPKQETDLEIKQNEPRMRR